MPVVVVLVVLCVSGGESECLYGSPRCCPCVSRQLRLQNPLVLPPSSDQECFDLEPVNEGFVSVPGRSEKVLRNRRRKNKTRNLRRGGVVEPVKVGLVGPLGLSC